MKTDFVKTDDDEAKLICDNCYFLWRRIGKEEMKSLMKGKCMRISIHIQGIIILKSSISICYIAAS